MYLWLESKILLVVRLFVFFSRWFWLLANSGLLLGMVVACATPSAPEGGPRDMQPPRLNAKRYSTPNPSTNFNYNRVILTFDEWVRLQAASSNVVMSPPLEKRPTIRVRNKSVVVEWKEALEDSTTYIINFGDAIQDITEGNVVPNMKMVFSTGPYVDSLKCTGQVIDAATRQPSADVWVMLYRNLADSVPKTERPFYFAKTNNSGNFTIDYIRKGRYQIFALDDNNNDYKYNLPGEAIGFLDSSFVINDSIQPLLRLLLFEPRRELAVEEADLLQFGEVRLTLNEAVQSPTQVQLLDAPADMRLLVEQGDDSLHLWFDGTIADTAKLRFVLTNEVEAWQDTVVVSNREKANLLEDSSALRWFLPETAGVTPEAAGKGQVGKGNQGASSNSSSLRPAIDTTPINQHPKEALALRFTAPIVAIDSSQFIWEKDTVMEVQEWRYTPIIDSLSGDTLALDSSQVTVARAVFLPLPTPTLRRDSSAANVISFAVDSMANQRYRLTILPKGIRDFWERSNYDTLSRIYTINSTEEYGSITTIIKGADSTQQYVVELVNDKNSVVKRRLVQDSSTITLLDYYLPTGPYTIRVSTDLNRNKRWDVGDYENKQQPEPRYISNTIQLKAGWENAMEIDLEKKASSSGKSGKGSLQAPEEEEDDRLQNENLPDAPEGKRQTGGQGKGKMKQ